MTKQYKYACRECGEDFITDTKEENSEMSICEQCFTELENNVNEARLIDVLRNIRESINPNNIFSHIDIEDKEECALWCGLMFEKEKSAYLEMGHTSESYEGFLVQTYVSTKESFPETIEAELGANKGELEN